MSGGSTRRAGPFPVLLRHRFQAPPARVFAAFTRPHLLDRWWGGADARVRQLDLRVGGRYEMDLVLPGGATQRLFGTYLEVSPPHRLVFTWNWTAGDLQGSESRVTLIFHDHHGATELELIHEPFDSTPERDQHRAGWERLFGRLTADLEAFPQ